VSSGQEGSRGGGRRSPEERAAFLLLAIFGLAREGREVDPRQVWERTPAALHERYLEELREAIATFERLAAAADGTAR
jgi:hypothetical protein